VCSSDPNEEAFSCKEAAEHHLFTVIDLKF